VVAIDTSGSTERDLPAFFSELSSLLASFNGYTMTVIQCDHAIQSVRTFSSDEGPIPSDIGWRARGFGGTSFVPVFQYVEDHPELEPTLLVFFTDGDGTAPAKAPPYPVLWVLTSNGTPPAPWGAVARFAGR
jgi:predicted metal-dependent peptidase